MPEEPTKDTKIDGEKKPQEAMSTSEQTQNEDGIPEDSSERTREQFEKLKEHNRQLAEENRRLKESPKPPSVLDSLKPKQEPVKPVSLPKLNLPNLSQGQQEDILSRLVDEEGYVDKDVLVKTLKDANERASRAEEEARLTRQRFESIQENQQVRAANEKFPQLDPNSEKFDQEFYNSVRNELIGQMVSGREKDLVLAASTVAKNFRFKSEGEPKSDAAETKEKQVRQIQATSTNRGNKTSNVNQDELVQRTLRGDSAALAERLRRAGF